MASLCLGCTSSASGGRLAGASVFTTPASAGAGRAPAMRRNPAERGRLRVGRRAPRTTRGLRWPHSPAPLPDRPPRGPTYAQAHLQRQVLVLETLDFELQLLQLAPRLRGHPVLGRPHNHPPRAGAPAPRPRGSRARAACPNRAHGRTRRVPARPRARGREAAPGRSRSPSRPERGAAISVALRNKRRDVVLSDPARPGSQQFSDRTPSPETTPKRRLPEPLGGTT